MKLLLRGASVLRMDAADTFLDEGYVLVEDGLISAVGPAVEAPSDSEANHVEDLTGCIIVPGLINSHQHHWYGLLKGMSEGLYLEDWVERVLVPATAELSRDDLMVSMRLAAADMLATGTTTFFNHSVSEVSAAVVDELAEVSSATGIRQVFGKELRATPAMVSPREHRHDVELLLERYPVGSSALFAVGLAVETGEHWIRQGTMTPELAGYASGLARRYGVPVSDHVTGGTLARSVTDFRHRYGLGQVEWIAQHGLLSEHSLLAHAVWIDENEVALAAQAGSTIVSCPSSSAFTAGGIPPIRGWLEAGVNVAIGSDGPMVNDSVDVLGLLREAFLLQNAKYSIPAAVRVRTLLRLVTSNAAHGLGIGQVTGQISPGRAADLAVFDLRTVEIGGALNPPVNLVLSGSHTARFVIVNGEVVVDPSGVRTMDVDRVVSDARQSARDLARRAGLMA